MASLLILKGANQGERYQLADDKVVLGRNPDCHVVIAGTAVSRAHANILRVNGKYFIEDLESRNKTYVNNQEIAPLKQVPLQDNDRIKICDFLCTFNESAFKPLPEALRPDEPEPSEDNQGSTTVEATVGNLGSNILLDTQPAEKLKALLEITSNLSQTLELDPLLPTIVDSLFQLFKQADRGFIILQDQTAKKLMPKVIKTRRLADETTARFSRKIVNQCLETVQALLSDDATNDSRFALSQSIADFRIRSVMCAPLWSQDGTGFGVIQLDTQDRTKKFTQDDLKLLMGVAGSASVALERAKLHENLVARERLRRDLELAREVQQSFLPARPPKVPGYEFFSYYEAAQEVGGDYFDFIPLPQLRQAIMIGDVAGKGVPAALLMAKISADARYCMLTESGPAKAITRLNGLLQKAGLRDRFVTLLAALLDPVSHTVTFVNAGHPSPVIYHKASADLSDAVPTEVAGLPIGILEDQEYSSCEVKLEPGDCIIAFSDGVTDSMDVKDTPFNIQGIYNTLRGGSFTPRTLGEKLVKAIKQHAAGRNQHDDITLVVVGRTSDDGVDANATTRPSLDK
jgi:serine phosphatase RsbU (regulator of sigma subunit)/pSer/pThr/pTyr-binding forkhead associated (FHA) protein